MKSDWQVFYFISGRDFKSSGNLIRNISRGWFHYLVWPHCDSFSRHRSLGEVVQNRRAARTCVQESVRSQALTSAPRPGTLQPPTGCSFSTWARGQTEHSHSISNRPLHSDWACAWLTQKESLTQGPMEEALVRRHLTWLTIHCTFQPPDHQLTTRVERLALTLTPFHSECPRGQGEIHKNTVLCNTATKLTSSVVFLPQVCSQWCFYAVSEKSYSNIFCPRKRCRVFQVLTVGGVHHAIRTCPVVFVKYFVE